MSKINNKMVSMDGNEATAYVAYRATEMSAIYPITPSSPMGELADQWAVEGRKNIWDSIPEVIEMQSEGGASGTLHGAIQAGALCTTFTASQGLLLMIPNMYKIAGELTPTVIHVAARSLAAQALSIFGDHSDVMATRDTGFAMLSSGSVQEAHDMALISHAATLETRIPFLHFFEGFRVSHEVNKIELLSDEQIRSMIDDELVLAHRSRALSPDHPCIRGTAQNPDVYFQGRETVNPFYKAAPGIVQKIMNKFGEITGRHYNLVDYFGDTNAECVIVIMGSGAYAVREIVEYLCAKGEKVGLLQIHLYRPFPKEEFLKILPETVKSIAVLDRTKEPGSVGEPLYMDVVTTLSEMLGSGEISTLPTIIGGRYGLSSKEFTPAMVKSIFDELKKQTPKNHFTIGINDDLSHTSLDFDSNLSIAPDDVVRAVFYGLGSDGTVGANKNTIKIIGDGTDLYVQGYFVYDSKKSGSRTVSYLRFGPRPICSSYLIKNASFIGCHQFNFIKSYDVLSYAVSGATLLLNSPYSADEVWSHLPRKVQQEIITKKIKFYVIDAYKVAKLANLASRINTVMQVCFFALANILPVDDAIERIKKYIHKSYIRKGEDIVKKNFAAVDKALENLHEVKVPESADVDAEDMTPVIYDGAPKFVKEVLQKIMLGNGDDLPVSAFPNDGSYPTGTAKWEYRDISNSIFSWNPDVCIQCGRCVAICPHGGIRVKRYHKDELANAPSCFKSAVVRGKGQEDMRYTLQTYLEACTGCGLCHEVCLGKNKADSNIRGIKVQSKQNVLEEEKQNIKFFETLSHCQNASSANENILSLQFKDPLFEFPGACAGCGETPYIKMVSQLFGDRMLIANATGCSSIYCGNLPTTPLTKNSEGRGPAWSNSLFEDNAEFGLGFRLANDKQAGYAAELLQSLVADVGESLVIEILEFVKNGGDEAVYSQRQRIAKLKEILKNVKDVRARHLEIVADCLVKRSVWIIGGDGWAYDIGYGGLDHVLSTGRDVNVLVMDTEVYSNTGGQASKATSRAAVAKFAAAGKRMAKKDLALMVMTYGNVYIAQIALGANPVHALKAIQEAERYPGPSLIIAYSHCIAHGIDMSKGPNQQRLAVESGYWPLFRYDPKRKKDGLNPFVLDSKKPTIDLKEYAYNENRFKSLLKLQPDEAEQLLQEAQDDVNNRWALYEKLARD